MWSDFESEVVEGRYPLGKLVRSEGRCGWFETRFDETAAIVSLIESLNDESMLLDRLRVAAKISNVNVAAISAVGTTQLHGTPLVYAVMEFTEENLEDGLRARALSADETKQVAESLVNALQAIHKERLVCGRLEAASVLAAGDIIKLRSDYLQLVPPDASFESYAAKDVRDLGNLLYQCLTQKPLKSGTDANDPSLQLLPPPFVQIMRRTLTGHATLDEIAALLRPPASAPAPASVQSVPAPVQKESRVPVPPVRTSVPVTKAGSEEAEEAVRRQGASRAMPKSLPLIIGGFLVLLLIAGFVVRALLRPSPSTPDAPVKSAAPVAPAQPVQSSAAVAMTAAKPKAAPASRTIPPAASTAGAWRVVAFTYNRADQAEHKAQSINEKHPDLQAGVFSPKGSGAPYLVTLGAATDRASAFRMRNKAVEEGLPRDTYAQNYSR